MQSVSIKMSTPQVSQLPSSTTTSLPSSQQQRQQPVHHPMDDDDVSVATTALASEVGSVLGRPKDAY